MVLYKNDMFWFEMPMNQFSELLLEVETKQVRKWLQAITSSHSLWGGLLAAEGDMVNYPSCESFLTLLCRDCIILFSL